MLPGSAHSQSAVTTRHVDDDQLTLIAVVASFAERSRTCLIASVFIHGRRDPDKANSFHHYKRVLYKIFAAHRTRTSNHTLTSSLQPVQCISPNDASLSYRPRPQQQHHSIGPKPSAINSNTDTRKHIGPPTSACTSSAVARTAIGLEVSITRDGRSAETRHLIDSSVDHAKEVLASASDTERSTLSSSRASGAVGESGAIGGGSTSCCSVESVCSCRKTENRCLLKTAAVCERAGHVRGGCACWP